MKINQEDIKQFMLECQGKVVELAKQRGFLKIEVTLTFPNMTKFNETLFNDQTPSQEDEITT